MSLLLGVYIYGMLLGEGEDTVKSTVGDLMQQQIERQKIIP